MPAVTPAAACSDSGSMKISGLSEMLRCPLRDLLGPVLAHLRRRRDRVGAGGVGGLALDVDHGGIAVDRIAHAGVLDLAFGDAGAGLRQQAERKIFS
jgi:hypothetical protein